MSKAASIYKFTCTANGSDVLLVSGGFYKLLSSTGTVQITRQNGSVIGPLLAGQGEREEFTRLTIKDTSGAANTGYIVIADESFIDDRIYGEVSVIDGEKARVLAGGMYALGLSAGPIAAQVPFSMLWNPVGSGKNIIINSVSLTSASAQGVNMRIQNATYGAASFGQNKKGGASPTSIAEGRTQTSVTPAAGAQMATFFLAAGGFQDWVLKGPIVLPPGYGLEANGTTVNVSLSMNTQWFEETA